MAGKIFMDVEEVAAEMDVSVPYAYKLIRQLNEELKATLTSKSGMLIIFFFMFSPSFPVNYFAFYMKSRSARNTGHERGTSSAR